MTDDLSFDPERVTVDAGATVEWVNESDVGHTVTASADAIPASADFFASGGFDTERAARNDMQGGLVAAGERYSHTFERSGTYEYYCIPHEGSGMVGSVRVR
ncbi:cupredoxin domain-containing protein [Salinibaculum marinum]